MLYVNAWYSIMIDSQFMKRQNKLESKYKESLLFISPSDGETNFLEINLKF